MKNNSSIRSLVLIWLGWAVVMLAFQHWIGARLELRPPDNALPWNADETTFGQLNTSLSKVCGARYFTLE